MLNYYLIYVYNGIYLHIWVYVYYLSSIKMNTISTTTVTRETRKVAENTINKTIDKALTGNSGVSLSVYIIKWMPHNPIERSLKEIELWFVNHINPNGEKVTKTILKKTLWKHIS